MLITSMKLISHLSHSGSHTEKRDKKRARKAAVLSHFPGIKKAGTGNRTRDLRTTNATLYRLSHASKSIFVSRDYVSLSNTISFVNQNEEKKSPKRDCIFTISTVNLLRCSGPMFMTLFMTSELACCMTLFMTSELACCEPGSLTPGSPRPVHPHPLLLNHSVPLEEKPYMNV